MLHIYYEVHTISFQTFFVWELLLIVHTWNSSPLRSNLQLQYTCTVPTTSGRLYGSPLVWACQWPSSQPLSRHYYNFKCPYDKSLETYRMHLVRSFTSWSEWERFITPSQTWFLKIFFSDPILGHLSLENVIFWWISFTC